MDQQSGNGILEDFRIEFMQCWHRMPNKGLFLVLLAAWLALFQFLGNSTLGYIHTPSLLQWMHATYQPSHDPGGNDDSYGRWIPFIVLGLFWWKRKQLMALRLGTWWPGLMLLGFALAVHLAGFMIQQPKLSIMAMFIGIYALMGLAWGGEWLRESFFPFILLAFCVPLGWAGVSLTFPLRMLVMHIVQFICNNLLAIDVMRDGTKLLDPSGRYGYEVAAACSGLRSLIATLAIAVIFAMVSFRSWWRRAVLIGSALPFAVLGNVVRMMAIVIAAEIWGQNGGKAVDDGGPGGVFALLPYIPAFAGLLILGRFLEEPRPKSASPSDKNTPEHPAPTDETGARVQGDASAAGPA
jgi:exosortase